MFGLESPIHLLILVGVIVLLFGGSKLPQLGAGIGQGIRNFKKAMKDDDAIDVTPVSSKKSGDSSSPSSHSPGSQAENPSSKSEKV